MHASFTDMGHHSAVAWCDPDVKRKSWDCDTRAYGLEYGSPFSLMGYGRDEPFYIDGKLIFDWADSLNHPNLVSSVDWDPNTEVLCVSPMSPCRAFLCAVFVCCLVCVSGVCS